MLLSVVALIAVPIGCVAIATEVLGPKSGTALPMGVDASSCD
ncbi:MAG: hypothetical protein ACOYLQ_19340 [Hyphomicrobiaceae bacterium]